MGLFSQYGTNSMTGEIVADESYVGVEGAYRLMSESHTNLCAINHAILEMDYITAGVDKGLLNESALEIVNEAAGEGIWGRVVEFIKKIGEKIVGLFKAAAAKIQGMCNKDGKDLCSKYEKVVYSKVNKGECSKMKFKWSEPTGASFDLTKSGDIDTAITNNIMRYTSNKDRVEHEYEAKENSLKESKPYDTSEVDEFKQSAYADIVGSKNTTKESLHEDMKEKYFKDEDDKEGLTSDIVAKVIEILKENKKDIKTVNDSAKTAKRFYEQKRKEAENVQKLMSKELTKPKKGRATLASAYAQRVITLCNLHATVVSEVQSVWLSLVKENFKQARSILTRAAAWSQSKPFEEQSSLMTGIEETSDMLVEEMFSIV